MLVSLCFDRAPPTQRILRWALSSSVYLHLLDFDSVDKIHTVWCQDEIPLSPDLGILRASQAFLAVSIQALDVG